MTIPASELILNPDGSVYHLHLHPEQIASTIITVGDPDRVDTVTSHFDTITHTVQRREFKTTTGTYKGKEITVISTGIGTDNIDIVFNELDALVNIDLKTRKVKDTHTSLDIIRIGTSGAIQEDISIDAFLLSDMAIGLDALLHFYDSTHIQHPEIQKAFVTHMNWSAQKSEPYIVTCDRDLASHFLSNQVIKGVTATNIGFYAPQGRVLRLQTSDPDMNKKLGEFRFRESKITNLEMETAGIYGLAKLLEHRAISLNAILANRATGIFSNQPSETVNSLIIYTLNRIATM
ncbi:phosphorylase [Dokdonia pacifica]|uniref:Uridine phosphorylase n=1 Tax=Dokdonia pacifica TaxID=1627892 RepID=A0A239DSX5_9FLAO|nr:nucleoside phosphorylase [Dokdonia pacifica]GGG41130.1 phosphorylase [Dokdonia pacifica]SNS35725.1 uridine phosphorylase [Dokdonia pacifica]